MNPKSKKIINVILFIIAVVISGIGLCVFLWEHALIGLILTIVGAVVGIAAVIINLCSKAKTVKSIVFSIVCCIISIAILVFSILGTIKINNMKNEIKSKYKSWLNENFCSYTDQIWHIEKILDLQESMEELEESVKRLQAAQDEYDRKYN